METRLEEIASDMTREMGKPLREARLEAARVAAIFRFFAGEAWRPKGEQYEQSATGSVQVVVPKSRKTDAAIDSGGSYDSTH